MVPWGAGEDRLTGCLRACAHATGRVVGHGQKEGGLWPIEGDMSFSFPFLFPPRPAQNTGRGAERISNTEPTLVSMGANRGEGKTVQSCRREIAVSVFFCVLGASCGQRRNSAAWTSLGTWVGTQVPRHPGPRGSNCTWDASTLQASGLTCAKVRKVQGAVSLPQGLLSLPHCPQLPSRPCKCSRVVFMRPISSLADTLLPPADSTHRQTPQQGLGGRPTVRGTAQVCRPAGKTDCKCVTRRLRVPSRRARCDFHITLQISPRPAPFLDLIPPSLPHTFQILSLPKGQHTLSE